MIQHPSFSAADAESRLLGKSINNNESMNETKSMPEISQAKNLLNLEAPKDLKKEAEKKVDDVAKSFEALMTGKGKITDVFTILKSLLAERFTQRKQQPFLAGAPGVNPVENIFAQNSGGRMGGDQVSSSFQRQPHFVSGKQPDFRITPKFGETTHSADAMRVPFVQERPKMTPNQFASAEADFDLTRGVLVNTQFGQQSFEDFLHNLMPPLKSEYGETVPAGYTETNQAYVVALRMQTKVGEYLRKARQSGSTNYAPFLPQILHVQGMTNTVVNTLKGEMRTYRTLAMAGGSERSDDALAEMTLAHLVQNGYTSKSLKDHLVARGMELLMGPDGRIHAKCGVSPQARAMFQAYREEQKTTSFGIFINPYAIRHDFEDR